MHNKQTYWLDLPDSTIAAFAMPMCRAGKVMQLFQSKDRTRPLLHLLSMSVLSRDQ
jgi:hypothetical protein